MARGGIIGIGIVLIVLAVAGYITPLSITLPDTTVNLTIPQMVAFCESGLGHFAQLSPQIVLVCSEYNNFMIGIYGSGLFGIILIIVGSVTGKKKEDELEEDESEQVETPIKILKERYAKGEISKEEFEKMKEDLEN